LTYPETSYCMVTYYFSF